MHDGLHYGQPELITPQMEKNVGKARTARSRSGAALWLSRAVMRVSRLWGGLDTLVFMAGIGENMRQFAAICEHLEFLGIRLFSPQRAKRRDHFPSRESGHRSRDDDQRRTDDRRQTGHLMRHQKGIIHEIH